MQIPLCIDTKGIKNLMANKRFNLTKLILCTTAASLLYTAIPLTNASAISDVPKEEKAKANDKKSNVKTLEQIEKDEKKAKKQARIKAKQEAQEKRDKISNAKIEKKKRELKQLDTTLRKNNKTYGQLKDSIAQMEDEYEEITNRIHMIDEQSAKKMIEMTTKEKELAQLRNDIADTEEQRAEREEEFKKRAKSIYADRSNGEFSRVLEVIVHSDGFSSVINNLISYKKIVQLDNQIIEEYLALVEKLEVQTIQAETVVQEIQNTLKELTQLKQENEVAAEEKLELTEKLDKRRQALKDEIGNLKLSKGDTELALSGLIENEILDDLLAEIEKTSNSEREEAEKQQIIDEKLEVVADTVDTEVTTKEIDEKSKVTVSSTQKTVAKEDMSDYFHYINYYAKKYKVPSALVKAVIQQESSFRADATNANTNGTIDRGLMQINSNTGPGIARQLGWEYKTGMEFVPKTAIEMGAYYLSTLYTPDLHRTLSSYNRGSGGARTYYRNYGSYVTTYSAGVMGYMKVYVAQEQKTKNGYMTDKAAALVKIAGSQSVPSSALNPIKTTPKPTTPAQPSTPITTKPSTESTSKTDSTPKEPISTVKESESDSISKHVAEPSSVSSPESPAPIDSETTETINDVDETESN